MTNMLKSIQEEIQQRIVENLFNRVHAKVYRKEVAARGPVRSAEELRQIQEIQKDFFNSELDDRFKKDPMDCSFVVRKAEPFSYGLSKMEVGSSFTILNDDELYNLINSAYNAGYLQHQHEAKISDS